jgi:putative inorganic carbon (HCO3(-)) transporter
VGVGPPLFESHRLSQIGLGLLALAIGLAMAALPPGWAMVGMAAAALLVLTFVEPLVGLAAALFLGPLKPIGIHFHFSIHLPLDVGQIALLVTLAAWFAHAVSHRRRLLPTGPLMAPLLIFVGAASMSLPGALSIGYALKELIKWAQLILVMWLVVWESPPSPTLPPQGGKGVSPSLRARAKHGAWGRGWSGGQTWQPVIAIVLGVAAFQAVIGIWEFGIKGWGPEHFSILDHYYRARGTLEQPNPYGGFIGMGLLLAVGLTLYTLEEALRERTLAAFGRLAGPVGLSALLAVALVMSWSRGAWLGVAVGALAILLAWPRRWWVGAGLVIGGAAGMLLALQTGWLPASIADRLTGFVDFTQTFDVRGADITPESYAVLERLAHWQAAEEMARYHPWVGVGFGNYEPVYPGYALMSWPNALGHAHNYYLNLLAETGIVGLTAYLILWAAIIWLTWRVTRRTVGLPRGIALGMLGAWVHLSVHQLVDNLYVANLHLHLGALMGVLAVLALGAGIWETRSGNEHDTGGARTRTLTT